MAMSLGAIAAAVGLADHTTVHYGLRQVATRPDLKAQAETIWQGLTAAGAPVGQEAA
jgi:chromosomal replication initiation ATPase DnaA